MLRPRPPRQPWTRLACAGITIISFTSGCCQLFPDSCGQPETTLRTDVILVRSGGLVATNDQVTVTQDGTFTSSGTLIANQTRPLSSLELSGLLDRLAGWDQLTVGARNSGCADAFEYSITYAGRTLAWDDCTQAVPQQLRDLADYLLNLAQLQP